MITPNEFKSLRYQDTDNTAIEQRIDSAIKKSTRLPVRIAKSLFQGVQGDLEHVLHSYRLLGWYVAEVSDWRDGDFIEMSLP